MASHQIRKLIEVQATDKSPMPLDEVGELLVFFGYQVINLGITTMDNYSDIVQIVSQAHHGDWISIHGDEDSISLPRHMVGAIILTKDTTKYSMMMTDLDDTELY